MCSSERLACDQRFVGGRQPQPQSNPKGDRVRATPQGEQVQLASEHLARLIAAHEQLQLAGATLSPTLPVILPSCSPPDSALGGERMAVPLGRHEQLC